MFLVGCILLWVYGKWAGKRVKAFIKEDEKISGRDRDVYEAAMTARTTNSTTPVMTTV